MSTNKSTEESLGLVPAANKSTEYCALAWFNSLSDRERMAWRGQVDKNSDKTVQEWIIEFYLHQHPAKEELGTQGGNGGFVQYIDEKVPTEFYLPVKEESGTKMDKKIEKEYWDIPNNDPHPIESISEDVLRNTYPANIEGSKEFNTANEKDIPVEEAAWQYARMVRTSYGHEEMRELSFKEGASWQLTKDSFFIKELREGEQLRNKLITALKENTGLKDQIIESDNKMIQELLECMKDGVPNLLKMRTETYQRYCDAIVKGEKYLSGTKS